MSNNYFNRARTAKNRIEDTDDVIELVEGSNHIYYVRTNQHEYLVDLSFTANTGETGKYTNNKFDLSLPKTTSGKEHQDLIRVSYHKDASPHLPANYTIFPESDYSGSMVFDNNIIPTIGDYNADGSGDQGIYPHKIRFNWRESNGSTDLGDFGMLGMNQFRDFDYLNSRNSLFVDPYHLNRRTTLNNPVPEGNYYFPLLEKSPITYCSELNTYGLSWGLPNLEIIRKILFSGSSSNILGNRIKDHFYSGSLPSMDVLFGLYTQYFLKVKAKDAVITSSPIQTALGNIQSFETSHTVSAVQMVVSLNHAGKGGDTGKRDYVSLLEWNSTDIGKQQVLNISEVIQNSTTTSDEPQGILLTNNIGTRIALRFNDDTPNNTVDDTIKDLPMLIIPTAIIR